MKNLKNWTREELVAEYARLGRLIEKTPKHMRRNVCPSAFTNKSLLVEEISRRNAQ